MSRPKVHRELDPWERQPGESAKAYEAFCVYRDQGAGRSLNKTAKQLGKSATLISVWSYKNRWVERCEAWDRWLAEERRRAQVEAIRKMEERHIRLAQGMQTLAARKLERELERTDPNRVGIEAAREALDSITLQEVRLLITEGTKLERVARGEPETITEERQVVDWASAVTERWRDRLAREKAAAAAKPSEDDQAEEGEDTAEE